MLTRLHRKLHCTQELPSLLEVMETSQSVTSVTYHRFRQNKEEAARHGSRIRRLFCIMPQAWLHKPAQVEMRVTQAPLLIFFRDPIFFYGELLFEEGMILKNQMSIQQGDFDVFWDTAKNRTGQWASKKGINFREIT